ncbi:Retinal Maintenance, putative [Leishmania lindenbergi]|uniref:Cilia- and flagella-associated protein 418 n=1 Tax=Leishmania lindenbergi TaxID=651832 RepID=A0AAW3AJ77_9TRYP
MSELDSLIDELFPEKPKNECNLVLASESSRRRSEWDDESDDGQDIRKVAGTRMHAGQQQHPCAVSYAPPSSSTSAITLYHTRCSIGHFFDNDSDADGDVGHLTTHRGEPGERADSEPNKQPRISVSKPVLFPVPFPSLSDSEGSYACASRCYLTNLGAFLTSDTDHPTLQELRAIAVDEQANAGSSRIQAMLRKGAFHAAKANLGNGCLDHHGDFTVDGGCPHILCRHCNYMVVRLQGAQWEDDGVNLYLTLRNYYPDWCRLASATPVGVEDGAEASRCVLRTSLPAAAYCCQCSWVTVRCAKAVVETRLTDITMIKPAKEGEHPFATELPLPPGENRRPPLWVCHGHTR